MYIVSFSEKVKYATLSQHNWASIELAYVVYVLVKVPLGASSCHKLSLFFTLYTHH